MLDGGKPELLTSEALLSRSGMATEDSLPIQSAFKQRGLSATAYTYLPLSAAPGNPILKRPHASTLFQHYITVTARHLPVAMWMEDTFIAHILPLAHSDDLVLQGVLALSGAHLSFKSTDGDIKQATWTHYALALRGVKHALTRTMSGGDVDMLHLLLTTLLLCQVEVSPLKA
jgi:Fungal specific transcription factor domain